MAVPLISSPSTRSTRNCSKKINFSEEPKADYVKGMCVFVSHEDKVWTEGVVAKSGKDSVIDVECSDGQIRHVEECKLLLRGENVDFVRTDHLSQLKPLHEASVLHCLRKRFLAGSFYTNAGMTLVAINPFSDVPHLYGNKMITKYHDPEQKRDLAPHIYSVADLTYTSMTADDSVPTNQSIIVSGESGAGKTVSAKHLMRFLTSVAIKSPMCQETGGKIEGKILDSNPILEAFGNACTIRNHNSSRFGKYIELQYNRTGQIVGAVLSTYLLEKTRVTHQNSFENNFHVFYQFLNGASDLERTHCLLSRDTDYLIADLNDRNEENDAHMWKCMKEAMDDMGITDDDQLNTFKILAAILHLGNIQFCQDEEDEDICVVSQASIVSLDCASSLLGVDSSHLESSTTHRQITATHSRRKSVFYHPCDVHESFVRRDCLAKLLYSSLFTWLVDYINHQINSENEAYTTIGLLDIYGFEHFQENSLEQLCINYANEKLQQHFVSHFFKELQAEYTAEGIPWVHTDYEDNRPCLELLELNPGIFSLIDEECHLKRPTDIYVLSNRMQTSLQSSSHFRATCRSQHSPVFSVRHYASTVAYKLEGMIEKNKDDVPGELVELLKKSSRPFVANLFSAVKTDAPGKKKKTVLSKFKLSLDNLMNSLQQTQPHYIRCIKPNNHSQAAQFDSVYVMSQLKACGVIETVEISRHLYPAKYAYEEFLKRYGLILKGLPDYCPQYNQYASSQSDDEKENDLFYDPLEALFKQQLKMTPNRKSVTPKRRLRRRAGLSSIDHTRRLVAAILKQVDSTQNKCAAVTYQQFGRSMIFLKDGQLEQLESRRSQILSSYAFIIQCAWRRYQSRKRQRTMLAATTIQSVLRGWLMRRRYHKLRAAVLRIQAWFRQRRSTTQKAVPGCPAISTEVSTESEDSDNSLLTTDTASQSDTSDEVESHQVKCDALNSSNKLCGFDRMKEVGSEIINLTSSQSAVRCTLIMSRVQQSRGNRLRSGPQSSPDMSLIAAAYPGIVYIESCNGILSRRRMPRIPIKFHTKVNPLLKYAHNTPRRELQCSLTDCLASYD